MAVAYSVHDLNYLLTAQCQLPGWKVLYCAIDVNQAMIDSFPEKNPSFSVPGLPDIGLLMGIDVVLSEDTPPGHFRLVLHDHCTVNAETNTVSHGECTIVTEGVLE